MSMSDDVYSVYIRNKKGLPDNWRVFYWEAKGDDKVLMKGALVRPITEFEKRKTRGYDWIKPFEMVRQMTVSTEVYKEITLNAGQ